MANRFLERLNIKNTPTTEDYRPKNRFLDRLEAEAEEPPVPVDPLAFSDDDMRTNAFINSIATDMPDHGENIAKGIIDDGIGNRLEEAAKGAIAGFVQTPSSAGSGLDVVGQITGAEPLSRVGKGMQASVEGLVPQARVATWDDVNDPVDALDWALYHGTQAIGSSAPSLVGGAIGASVGGVPGATAGALAPSYLQGVGEIYDNMKAEGVDSPEAAAVGGVVYAALDAIGPARWMGKLGKDAKKQITKTLVDRLKSEGIGKTVVKQVGKGALEEGVPEGLQEAASDVTVKLAQGKDLWQILKEVSSGESLQRYAESATAGTLGGTVMGTGAEVVQDRKQNRFLERMASEARTNQTDRSDVMGQGDTLPVVSQEPIEDQITGKLPQVPEPIQTEQPLSPPEMVGPPPPVVGPNPQLEPVPNEQPKAAVNNDAPKPAIDINQSLRSAKTEAELDNVLGVVQSDENVTPEQKGRVVEWVEKRKAQMRGEDVPDLVGKRKKTDQPVEVQDSLTLADFYRHMKGVNLSRGVPGELRDFLTDRGHAQSLFSQRVVTRKRDAGFAADDMAKIINEDHPEVAALLGLSPGEVTGDDVLRSLTDPSGLKVSLKDAQDALTSSIEEGGDDGEAMVESAFRQGRADAMEGNNPQKLDTFTNAQLAEAYKGGFSTVTPWPEVAERQGDMADGSEAALVQESETLPDVDNSAAATTQDIVPDEQTKEVGTGDEAGDIDTSFDFGENVKGGAVENTVSPQELGAQAFRAGLKRVPSLDSNLTDLLEGVEVGGSSEILDQWISGWDRANLDNNPEQTNSKGDDNVENEGKKVESAKLLGTLDMSVDEMIDSREAAKKREMQILIEAFGSEKAARAYDRDSRRDSDRAYDNVQKMESTLSPEMLKRVHGDSRNPELLSDDWNDLVNAKALIEEDIDQDFIYDELARNFSRVTPDEIREIQEKGVTYQNIRKAIPALKVKTGVVTLQSLGVQEAEIMKTVVRRMAAKGIERADIEALMEDWFDLAPKGASMPAIAEGRTEAGSQQQSSEQVTKFSEQEKQATLKEAESVLKSLRRLNKSASYNLMKTSIEKAKNEASPTVWNTLQTLIEGAKENALSEEVSPKQPTSKPKPQPSSNTVFTDEAAEKARAVLRSKLNNVNSAGIDPEVVQAGITLAGYHIEKGARTFAAYSKAMVDDMGETVKPYLKSWYQAVKFDPRAEGFEGFDTEDVVRSANVDDILAGPSQTEDPQQGESDVSNERGDTDLERDRQEPKPKDSVGQGSLFDESRSDGGGREQGVQQSDQKEDGDTSSGQRVSERETVPVGERGDSAPFADASKSEQRTDGDPDDQRGVDSGIDGEPVEPDGTGAVEKAATGRLDLNSKRAAQREAQSVKGLPADRENISKALPFLMEGQKDDVAFAETRFEKDDGYGVLFTNGTGTGKTATGLGIAKRYERQGKSNILIVVPSDKIANDWIAFAEFLQLDVGQLTGTNDAGKGIVVTTYANFGANNALVERKWDLVITDEAHYLMQSKNGDKTLALNKLRALTMHPKGSLARRDALHAEDVARLASLKDVQTAKAKAESDALHKKLDDAHKKIKADIESSQGKKRPRTVFLSATPFAYEKTVDYAEGYLFDYEKIDPSDSQGYNSGDGYEKFMMQHFGYRMRYNKLTEPDANVNRGLMQRMFNSWLKEQGSLSGRTLDVDFDYDRKFVLTESAVGIKIDEGLEWLWDNKRFGPVSDLVKEKFDHLTRRFLLEAIKAQEAVPIIKSHLALGRKVVVFHDYKVGGGFNPFDVSEFRNSDTEVSYRDDNGENQSVKLGTLVSEFMTERRDLVNLPLKNLPTPITTLQRAFPDAVLFNGDVSKRDRRANAEAFQTDGSGVDLIIGQSHAMKEGVSLHDTTGKHPRVLINLGLPTQPTTAIQQEGRIYRVGQASNAIFRYLNTGTNWERWAFGSTIAQRSSTAENLAIGEEARALLDAFVEGFEESDAYPAGHDGEGTGGKERDRVANEALTEWDRATALYFAQQKKTSKTKAKEGTDYFATPEPLGLKMVEWADVRGGESILEPSAGHGAIARWMPDHTNRTAVEPSSELASRLKMVFTGDNTKLIQSQFEDLHTGANKFDAIVMNPPFGSAGRTAIDHIAKAAQHLRDHGRIVALIPDGPATTKKLEKWFYNDEVDAKGKKKPSPSDDLYLVADVSLPMSTFERAGTKAKTRILVIEKQADSELAAKIQQVSRDYSNAEDINAFFDRIENASIPERIGVVDSDDATSNGDTAPKSNTEVAEGDKYVTDAPEVTHTTRKGKEIVGVIATDLTKEQAREFDKYTWKKDDGYFIRIKHVERPSEEGDVEDGAGGGDMASPAARNNSGNKSKPKSKNTKTPSRMDGWPDLPPDPIGEDDLPVPPRDIPMQVATPAQANKKGISPQKIMGALSDIVKASGSMAPIRSGRIPGQLKAAGIFKVNPEVIRVKGAYDIAVAAHEVAHAIEKAILGNPKGSPWVKPLVTPTQQKELLRLGKILYGDRKPNGGYKREGWAEFVRIYLTSDTAQQQAPEFFKWFEGELLPQHPGLSSSMATAKDLIGEWRNMGAVARAKASIVDGAGPKERLKRAGQTIKKLVSKSAWIDMASPLDVLAKEAERLSGKLLRPSENPFKTFSALATTHTRRVRFMVEDAMLDLAGNRIGPGLKEIESILPKGKDTHQDFLIYLWARRAMALWDDPLHPGGRNPGISREDAVQILEELNGQYGQRFALAADKVYNWNRGVLNYARQASPTFAQVVDRIIEKDPGSYVPLQRHFEDLSNMWARSGRSRGSALGSGAITRKLKGSTRPIKDPFQSMISNAQSTLLNAHQRIVAEQIIKLSKIEGMGHLVEEVPRDMAGVQIDVQQVVRQLQKKLGEEGRTVTIEGLDVLTDELFELSASDLEGALTVFVPQDIPKGQDPIIPIYEGGKVRWYQVDGELYGTLAGLDVHRLPEIGGLPILEWVFGMPTSVFRAGTTGLRAAFSLVTNPLRDPQSLFVNSISGANAPELMGAWLKSMKDAALAQTGKDTSEYWDAWVRLGGEMAQPLGQDTSQTRRAARQMFQGKKIKYLDPRNWLDFYRDLIQSPEGAPRVAELRTLAKEIGWRPGEPMSMDQSLELLLASKRVTTDFTSGGYLARIVNRIAPFHNAAIQGPRVTLRRLKEDPQTVTMRALGTITIPTLLMWWALKDEEWYQEMPWKEKFLYWHIPIDDGTVVRIPRAFEIGAVFAGLPEALFDAAYHQDPRAMKEWFGFFLEISTPNVTPVLLDEMLEQYANRDFFWDTPIEKRSDENKPKEERFDEYTTRTAIFLGDLFNQSPKRIDHAIRGIFGGMGGDVAALAGRGTGMKADREFELSDTPVLGRLFRRGGKVGSRPQSVQDLYDRVEQSLLRQNSKKNPETATQRQKRLALQDAARSVTMLLQIRAFEPSTSKRAAITKEVTLIAQDALRISQGKVSGADRARIQEIKLDAQARNKVIFKARLDEAALRSEIARALAYAQANKTESERTKYLNRVETLAYDMLEPDEWNKLRRLAPSQRMKRMEKALVNTYNDSLQAKFYGSYRAHLRKAESQK